MLIHAMKALIADHPHVRFHLYSGNDEDVSARLEKGLVDFGLFVGNTDLSGYDFLRLPVRRTRCFPRTKSCFPSSSSSSISCLDRVGWVICSDCAAAVMLPSRTTARK